MVDLNPADPIAKQIRDLIAEILEDELGSYAYRVPGEDASLVGGVSAGDTSVTLSSDTPIAIKSDAYIVFETDDPLSPASLEVIADATIASSTTVAIAPAPTAIADGATGEIERARFPAIRVRPPQLSSFFRVVPDSGVECVIDRDPSRISPIPFNAAATREETNWRVTCDQYRRDGDIYRTARILARQFARNGLNPRTRPQTETSEGLVYARFTCDIPVARYLPRNADI